MIPIFTLLLILTLSILITRFATVALTYTGLSREIARFQARSAFTGVGFTTSEAEKIVNHPVRRRIILLLMLFGNAGIVTVIASVVLTFVSFEIVGGSVLFRMILLLVGLGGIWIISANRWVDRYLSRFIGWMLKRYTRLDIRDYASLLHMAGQFKVVELYVEDNDWLADRTLQDLDLHEEGFLILGITRKDGTYRGAPDGATKVFAGDNLVIYGRSSAFEELDQRRKGSRGDQKHEKAVAEQKEISKKENKEDPAGKI